MATVSKHYVTPEEYLQREKRTRKGTHVNAGWLVPLILSGVVDLPMRTWFNLGDNAG